MMAKGIHRTGNQPSRQQGANHRVEHNRMEALQFKLTFTGLQDKMQLTIPCREFYQYYATKRGKCPITRKPKRLPTVLTPR